MGGRLYGEYANVHQSHSQNDSGDLRDVAGGDGELGCLCCKAGTSHVCDGSAHSSGCVVNGYIYIWLLPFVFETIGSNISTDIAARTGLIIVRETNIYKNVDSTQKGVRHIT